MFLQNSFEKLWHTLADTSSDWNPDYLPPYHPILLIRYFYWMLMHPQRLKAQYQVEYQRPLMNFTGAWLAGALMLLPTVLLLIGVQMKASYWLDLLSLSGLMGLGLLAVSLGFAAAVSVICDRPALFFATALLGFFGGLVIGLAVVLAVELVITRHYTRSRWPLMGYAAVMGLAAAQLGGLWVLLAQLH